MKPKLAFEWFAALTFIAFGVYSFSFDSRNWSLLAILLYSIPFWMLIFGLVKYRYYAFVVSFFLVMQCILPSLFRGDYFTLRPNFNWSITYDEGAVIGLKGTHHLATDEMGYRVTKKIPYHSPAEGFRIFTLGGSTTEMIYMDNKKIWSHLLQEQLTDHFHTPFEVANAALSGTRARHNLAALKYVSDLHPNLITILTGANDWRRDLYDHFYRLDNVDVPMLHRFADDRFFFKSSIVGYTIQAVKGRIEGYLEQKGWKQIKADFQANNPNKAQYGANCKDGKNMTSYFPEKVNESFSNSLREMKRICEEKKIVCVLLTQPNGYRPNVDPAYKKAIECNTFDTPNGHRFNVGFETMQHITDLYNNEVRQMAASSNYLRLCDLEKKISPNFENYFDDAHYTEKGSEVVANEVFGCVKAEIESQNLLPAKTR